MTFGFRLNSKRSESSNETKIVFAKIENGTKIVFAKIVNGFTLPFWPLLTLLLLLIANNGNIITGGSCEKKCLSDKMDSLEQDTERDIMLQKLIL